MPIARFEMPDGRIARFEVPEGTSPEQAQTLMQDYMTAQSPKPEGDLVDEAKGVLARTGRMAVGGATGLLGIATDPMSYAINELEEAITGKDIRNVPLRERALEAYDELTGDAGLPRNQLERMVQSGGEALTAGGAFAKTPAAMKTVTDMVSQMGAGTAAQWASENSDHPLAPLVASVTAAVAPQVLKQAPKAAARQIAKSLDVDPSRVAQLEAAGLPLNVPAASGSTMLKRATNQLAELPGGKALKTSIDDAFNTAEKSIKQLGFTGTKTPTKAGQVVSKAFSRWSDESLKAFEDVDDQLKNIIPDTANVRKADDIASSIDDIVNKEGLIATQLEDRANDPAIAELKKLLDSAVKNDGIVSIGALKEARTKVGSMMRANPLVPDRNTEIAKRSYESLSTIIEDSAQDLGGKAARELFQKRNKLYARFADENKNYVAKLQKKLGDTPEAIWNNLTSGSKIGASAAKRTLSKLNADEVDTVRDAWMYQLGGGDDFTIAKWSNKYRQLSEDAKDAFFVGKPALRKQHDALIDAVDSYQDIGRFANFSGTATTELNPVVRLAAAGTAGGTMLGLLTGTVSLPNVLGGAAVGYGINRGISTMLASPKYTKLLAKALENGGRDFGKYQKAVTRALVVSGAEEEGIQKIIDYDNSLISDASAFSQETAEIQNKQQAGTDNPYYEQVAQVESTDNYNALNKDTKAFGKYQFIPTTAKAFVKKYGDSIGVTMDNWKEPANQEKLVRVLTEENRANLTSFLKREPTAGEMYVAHFLGAGTGRKMLNPKNNARKGIMLVPQKIRDKVAKANKTIFFETDDKGKPIRTRSAFEVREILKKKMEN